MIEKNQQPNATNEDDKTPNKASERNEGDAGSNKCVKIHFLAVMLLVEFVESLERAMFNASDGCAVAVPPPNKVLYWRFIRCSWNYCICEI